MNPPFITIVMENIEPTAFALLYLERNTAVHFKQSIVGCGRTRADIAIILFDNHCRDFTHQWAINPALVAFKVFKEIPLVLFFDHLDGEAHGIVAVGGENVGGPLVGVEVAAE